MTNNKIVRGQALFVSIVFYDENAAVINPASATLRLAYTAAGVRATATVDMTSDGNGNWSAVWDSSPADAGPLFYWAASDDAPKAAIEGRLMIEANPANPQV